MFDFGFAQQSMREIVKYGEHIAEIYVAGIGKMALLANDGLKYSLTAEEKSMLKYEVRADKIIYPPVSAGDPGGILTIKLGDKEIGNVPLSYAKDVEQPEIKKKGLFSFWK